MSFNAFPGSYRVDRVDPATAAIPMPPAPQPSPVSVLPSVVSAVTVNAGTLLNLGGSCGPFPQDEQGIWRLLGGGQSSDGRVVDPEFLMGLRNHAGECFE
jgi:hypothetical protein